MDLQRLRQIEEFYHSARERSPESRTALPVAGGEDTRILDTLWMRAFALAKGGIYSLYPPGVQRDWKKSAGGA